MFCLKTLQIFGGNIMKYTKHVNLEKRKNSQMQYNKFKTEKSDKCKKKNLCL